MLKENEKSQNDFHPYYRDHSILIQLVFKELLASYDVVCQIQEWSHVSLRGFTVWIHHSSFLWDSLYLLVGVELNDEEQSSSLWTKGSLTKLKNYCEYISFLMKGESKEVSKLCTSAQTTWNSAFHLIEALRLNKYSFTEANLIHLRSLLAQFIHLFQCFVEDIPSLLKGFDKNENVLLCLWKKRELLCKIYGRDFMKSFFKEATLTPRELMDFLLERYKRRKFNHVILNIKQMKN